jgi:hypothetical protein
LLPNRQLQHETVVLLELVSRQNVSRIIVSYFFAAVVARAFEREASLFNLGVQIGKQAIFMVKVFTEL